MASINRGPLPQDNFSILANGWIRDKRLSWKARGLLLWLASHKPGFQVSLASIQAASKEDGRESARSAIKELETAGYLVRSVERGKGGKITGASYQLVDACPDCADDENAQVTTKVGFPDDGETDDGLTDVGETDSGSADVGSPAVGSPDRIRRTGFKKTNDQKTNGKSGELALAPAAGADLFEEPETAATVLAAYLDYCTAQHQPVPTRVKGHLAREIKQLLDDGFDVRTVKLGLAHWHEKGANPSALASFVQQAARSEAPAAGTTRTDARVQAGLDVARRMAEREASGQ